MSIEIDEIRRILSRCTISNGYSDIEVVKSFAVKNPVAAFNAIWEVLTATEDPGCDDGPLCFELLTLAATTIGRTSLEQRLLCEWDQHSDGVHRNLINGIASKEVISFDCAKQLFNRPTTRVRQRHRIVATLVSCRHDFPSKEILELARGIGVYDEPERQIILVQFLQSVAANYRDEIGDATMQRIKVK